MFRTLTALALGTALALAPMTAAPARADAEDVGKVIAGATALFIIGKVIKDHNDRKEAREEASRRDNDYGRHGRWNDRDRRWNDRDHRWGDRDHRWGDRDHRWGDRDHRWRDRDGRHDRGRQHARARVLPSQCLREVPERYGNRTSTWVGAGCLQRNNVDIGRLPRQCQNRVHAYGAIRTAYEPRCLIRSGYSFARLR